MLNNISTISTFFGYADVLGNVEMISSLLCLEIFLSSICGYVAFEAIAVQNFKT